MECNKEEAIRAKEVAEKKMQNRDFIGAKKMVLKAQQLFPELENISQMLTVCDVHCSAGIKVNGEMDLYGILKLEPTADDSAIKKQYHKLALSLHPDKNQFPGAEAAFKLIGEAQMTLKDKLKRYTYDMKRNGGLKPSQPKHKSQQSAKTSYSRTNSAAYNFNGLNQQQPSASTNPTFWTMCPKCNIKYQYYRAVLKRLMHCQNCQNTFIAEEVTQPVPTGASSGQSSFAFRKPQSQIPVQQAKSMNYQNHVGNPKEHRVKVASVDSDGKAATQHEKEDRGEKAAKPSTGSAGKKRQRNMIANSSDSESSDNDRINLNERSSPMNPNVSTARRRRSERLKQKVAYTDENGDDKSFEHTISPETAIGKTTTQGSEQTLPDGKADGIVGSGVKGTKVLNDGVENKKEGISSAGLSRLKQKVAYTDGNGDDKSFEHTISPETAIGKTTTQGSKQTLPDGKADGIVGSGVKGTKVLNDGIENKKEGISSAGLSRLKQKVAYTDGNGDDKSFEHTIRPETAIGKTTTQGSEQILPDGKADGIVGSRVKGTKVLNDGVENKKEGISSAGLSRLKQKVAYTDGNGDDKSFEHTISPETAIGKTTTQGSEQTLPDGKADGTVGSGVKGTKVLNDGVENKKKEGISSAGLSNENVIYEDGAEVGKGDTGVQVRTLTYPDPEFCDFDYRFRSASKFSIDQIWAVYDGLDGMPRFYARIKKIFVPLFEVHYTWLEHNPRNEAEEVWDEKELPVACGNFKLGKTESSTDLLMFSHIVCWEKGKRKNSYDIYPKKGEVWALFKGWNMEWRSDGDKNRKYRYEVVEVVSDFAPEKGISIIPLVKIKGFVSLFMHATGLINPVVIPASETHRFSHSVPSYRLTRKVKGVPQGSLELDTASLPEDYGETSPSIILDRTTGRVKKLDECHKSILTDESKEEVRSRIYNVYRGSSKAAGCVKEDQARRSHTLVHSDTEQLQTKTDEKNSHDGKGTNGENSVEECVFFPAYGMHGFTYDYPDPEFHNFDEARRIRNFSCGQIWALYCDIDRYPKYYGLVKKVDVEEHRVHVVWLEACPTKEEEKRWLNEELPISCGTFKVFQDTMTFEDADAFSHVVHAKAVDGKKNKHYIYPNCGEIWAIYKNWKPGWRKRDLHRCDYDVVEICETTGFSIKVRLLEKVSGYRTVFKCKGTGIAVTTIDIPFGDYIKFSHQIPAFMLTNEKGGKLRGYWELDPAAVPELLLISGF